MTCRPSEATEKMLETSQLLFQTAPSGNLVLQLVLDIGQRHAADNDALVENIIGSPNFNCVLFLAQLRCHPRAEHLKIDRLGDIVIRSGRQSLNDRFPFRTGGDHDDRQRFGCIHIAQLF